MSQAQVPGLSKDRGEEGAALDGLATGEVGSSGPWLGKKEQAWVRGAIGNEQ